MLRVGSRCDIRLMSPQITLAMIIASEVFKEHGHTATMAHVVDGSHMRASLHYIGNAVDLHWDKNWGEHEGRLVEADLAQRMGDQFDVVFKKDHIHCEFQPKDPVNIHKFT